MKLDTRETINARPFLKWAGGKTQLLIEFQNRLPESIREKKLINNYIEPFIGGGAMFFFLKRNYEVKNSIIMDINKELIIGYKTLKNDYNAVIDKLCAIEETYLKKTDDKRKEFYYKIRDDYNEQMKDFDYKNYGENWIDRTSFLIFINKTCFNGLFRQNLKGGFNVPFGRYKNPKICDKDNIIEVGKALKNTEIINGDFTLSSHYIEKESLVYLDPPYRPLNKTSNFTSYSKDGFDDNDQHRLAQFFKEMDKKGAYLMLSNSDPKNEDPDDEFFDNLYKEYKIERVPAKRFINCDASKRGEINELIIRNY